MNLRPLPTPRFVRRTSLGPNEYRKNFRQLDQDVIDAVTSREADRVTPLMSKIYLRLVNAPSQFREREGVLRFEAKPRGEEHVKAWDALCELLGVASATASKALRWMHGQGIIGYFAGKNGAGIRIFLNRASSSIGTRQAGEKILEFRPASSREARASTAEAASSDSFAVSEGLELDSNPRAPKSGAETGSVGKTSAGQIKPATLAAGTPRTPEDGEQSTGRPVSGAVSVEEIVERLRSKLEPCVREVATRAAGQAASREVERTRQWFETRALPKAVRVAQRETFGLLRKHGIADDGARRSRAGLEVGRADPDSYLPAAAHKLSPQEIREAAETCVALLEAQGKAIDVTLSEISSGGGGWLLPEDAPRVREAALELLGERGERR